MFLENLIILTITYFDLNFVDILEHAPLFFQKFYSDFDQFIVFSLKNEIYLKNRKISKTFQNIFIT